MRILAVVPAWNEAGRIGAVVAGLRALGLPVLVIDDGSHDATAAEARTAGAAVLTQTNAGKGAAILAGCRRAVAEGFQRVLLADGDGQHAPHEARRLLAALARTPPPDLVIGARRLDRARQPAVRRAANRLSSLIVTAAAGRRIWDSQSGYRLLDPRLLLRLPLRGRRYDLETEACILAARAGWRVHEVPVTAIYGGKRSGMHPLLDTLRFLRAVVRALAGVRGGRG
jgi:glycosyltransferase involved in cell wall biosynthesis